MQQKALSMLSHATARKFGRSSVALSSAAVVATCAYLALRNAKPRQRSGSDGENTEKDGPKEKITYFAFAGDFVDKIKIVDVVRYISSLCRDLIEPERLKKDPRNYVGNMWITLQFSHRACTQSCTCFHFVVCS